MGTLVGTRYCAPHDTKPRHTEDQQQDDKSVISSAALGAPVDSYAPRTSPAPFALAPGGCALVAPRIAAGDPTPPILEGQVQRNAPCEGHAHKAHPSQQDEDGVVWIAHERPAASMC